MAVIVAYFGELGQHLYKGFSDHLAPRLTQKFTETLGSDKADEVKKQVQAILDQLGNCIPSRKHFASGVPVDFWMYKQKNGVITKVFIDGKEVGVIDQKEFAWAMLDIYLGEKTKTPEVKQRITVGMLEYFKRICN